MIKRKINFGIFMVGFLGFFYLNETVVPQEYRLAMALCFGMALIFGNEKEEKGE